MQNHNLPPIQTGLSAWYGPDMATKEDQWLIHFSSAEIAEMEAAAEPLVKVGYNIGTMTAADFKLPALGKRLVALRQELIRGRGFALLRGLPVASYSEREAATIF